jgi:hypothetical protein
MDKKTSALIIFLLLIAAFLAGSTAAKIKYFDKAGSDQKTEETTPAAQPTFPPFEPEKTDKPEVKFFVMSFCPYGNQAEAGLAPVYQLLKDKVSWQPRYIISDKKAACEQNCPFRVYNESQCQQLVDSKKVADLKTCQGYFPYKTADECLEKECAKLKAGEYDSLHGKQELNQDVREICALNQSTEKVLGVASDSGSLSNWWKFIELVNQNCDSNNADTCWTAHAKAAGFSPSQISSCSLSQTKTLLNKEVSEATRYRASGSPTFYINDVLYQGGRAPEDLKKAICASFKEPPAECSQTLGQESAATSGGCGN